MAYKLWSNIKEVFDNNEDEFYELTQKRMRAGAAT